jgi:hypothetical protein
MTEKENKTVSFYNLINYLCLDHDISDTVLHMMDLASRIMDIEFNED